MSLRHLIVWPVAMTALLGTSGAIADDNEPSAIEQRLKALESTEERKALLREPAEKARKALKRVVDARTAGDAAHAVELASLADDWVRLAANVVRAVELEKNLATQHDELTKLEQNRRRNEILLEATIAQRERTREELQRIKASHAAQDAQTVAPPPASKEASKKRAPSQKPPAKAPTVPAAPSAPNSSAKPSVKP